jgi:hypothetical protein
MQETATAARSAMTDEERYLFDLRGFLVIPNALNAAELSALNGIMDEQIACAVKPDTRKHRFGPTMLHWGKPYRQLIDHPAIMPYIRELVGPNPRLDHDYSEIIRQGVPGGGLHGGGAVSDFSCSFTFAGGQMRCGLIAVAFNLHDVNPGDGGFAAVPGSHKANHPIPQQWIEVRENHPCVIPVTGPAGTAIIFSEALTHGTLPWRGAQERRTLFYKFSPSSLSWASEYYDAESYPDLTPNQRAMLEPPNARYAERKRHICR